MEHALAITPPAYSKVLQLDNKLRDWKDPSRGDPTATVTISSSSLPISLLFSGREICQCHSYDFLFIVRIYVSIFSYAIQVYFICIVPIALEHSGNVQKNL